MLAAFPLTTARDRHWWSQCGIPWGRQTHQQVSSQDHSKKGQWTCHIHQWSQLPLVASGSLVALEVMIFLAFCGLSFCGRRTGLSGRVFIVALSKSVHSCCVPHQAQASVPRAQIQAIRTPSIVSQADRLQSRGETNAGR